MEVNRVPTYDMSKNETGCCPRFDPVPWQDQELHFRDKRFVKATTRSLFHIPLNMGQMYTRTMDAIQKAGATDKYFAVLSCDPSLWRGEHYFTVTRDVPGQNNVTLSGDFLTHVFEGPYSRVRQWCAEMTTLASRKGKKVTNQYFFYPTCPKCSKHYGKNYVVAISQVSQGA